MSLQTLGEEKDLISDYEIAISILAVIVLGFIGSSITHLSFFTVYGIIAFVFSLLGLYLALTHY
jgi:hypothetical protein